MRTTRLTMNHRSLLYALVAQIVDCPAEIKAEQRAYDRAMPAARKIVEAVYAPKDMEVFLKYDRASKDNCIRVQLGDGDVKQFTFRADDAPYVPKGANCRDRMYLADERPGALIEAWVTAAKDLEVATEKKRAEYNAFVENAATFEQVVDIWPEAMQLSDRIRINLPAAVSPDMIERIKADSARRMKLAKAA